VLSSLALATESGRHNQQGKGGLHLQPVSVRLRDNLPLRPHLTGAAVIANTHKMRNGSRQSFTRRRKCSIVNQTTASPLSHLSTPRFQPVSITSQSEGGRNRAASTSAQKHR
jgi:hypothetical protein